MAIKLTVQDINNADAYIRIALKTAIAKQIAPLCIEKIEYRARKDKDADTTSLPPRYQENGMRKAQYLMGVLASLYLHKYEDDDLLMPLPEYDDWAGSFVFNQLERFKSISEVREKIFDLLSDYRETTKMLNAEIFALLQGQNDAIIRVIAMADATVTPQNMQSQLAQLVKLKDEFQKQTGKDITERLAEAESRAKEKADADSSKKE